MKINPVKSKKKFNTIILAAGKGTRIRGIQTDVPKPMVEIKGMVAIDFLIRKFKDVTDTFIICTGYKEDMLIGYLKTKFPLIKFKFVRQEEDELAEGPGKSVVLGLREAKQSLPTMIMFCDILFEDEISIEKDGLGLCNPIEGNLTFTPFAHSDYVYGTYKTQASIFNGHILNILKNKSEECRKDGWIGFAVCHKTRLLNDICEDLLSVIDIMKIDYSMDIMKLYVKDLSIKMLPIYVRRLYEFGTEDLLMGYRDEG